MLRTYMERTTKMRGIIFIFVTISIVALGALISTV